MPSNSQKLNGVSEPCFVFLEAILVLTIKAQFSLGCIIKCIVKQPSPTFEATIESCFFENVASCTYGWMVTNI